MTRPRQQASKLLLEFAHSLVHLLIETANSKALQMNGCHCTWCAVLGVASS